MVKTVMGADQAVNIAIFGLSLRTLNELKTQIQAALPTSIQVNWSNIAEPKLDILMINHIFFDSPNIRNLLKNNQIHVLQIANDSDKSSSIENGILYLPINHLHSLHHWLHQHLTEPSQAISAKKPGITPLNTAFQHTQIKEVLQEIQNPKNGKIQLFDQQGLLAIADPRNECLWQNPERPTCQTDLSLNYTYATQNDQTWISTSIAQDSRQWLWNLLWNSTDFEAFCPPSASSFHLALWPQPKGDMDRKNILRMSACFAQGAQISLVASQLNLPESQVRHFVASCLGSNFGKLIKDNESKYRPQQMQTETEQHFMKKLFGHLRQRLRFSSGASL